MSRHFLRSLGRMLGLLLLAGAVPAMAASQPTLFTMASGAPKILAQGAQKSWPINISEDRAFDAVFQGGMWLPNPSGGRIYAKYQRHILHANGTWTWIGTVSTVHGEQSVVLTFGKNGVFGLVPQVSGYPLRIVTHAGETRVVETSAAMSRSTQQLRLHSKPDYFVPPRMAPTQGVSTMSAAASAPVQAATSGGTVTIDVMVAYTTGFVNELGSQSAALARIQNLVDITNQAYVASGVNQQIRLVNTVQVSYPDNTSNDSALDDVTGLDTNGNPVPIPAPLQGIASLRVQYGADLVALIRSYDNATQGNCGEGWLIGGNQAPIVPSESNVYGYSVVSDGNSGGYYCLDTTFAHELGHNMGDAHDRANATESGAYPYSYGYLGNGTNGFSTIMAYGPATDTPLSLFSNPNVSACQNTPCGVADSASNSADNAHSMNNTAALIAQFEPTIVPLNYHAVNDINGDGNTDLLWMSQDGNGFAYWLLDGPAVEGSQNYATGGYHLAATADFNGDGFADLIWTNGSAIYVWVSDGSGGYKSQLLGYYSSDWTLVGAGDINGDGKPDLLWHSRKLSAFAYWIMNGLTPSGEASFPISSAYRFAGAGDFNGDGKLDIVWTDGSAIYVWLGDGNNFYPKLLGYYGDGWVLKGVADIDGDGAPDLLFHNQQAGSFAYWIVRNISVVKTAVFPIEVQFSIGAIGDFNGDGKADIMWTDGSALYEWLGDGNGFSSHYVANYGDGWSLIQMGEPQ